MSITNSFPTPAAPKEVDVIVVGAGLSGLRAALDVQAAGLSCIVVEAVDRVGGKTLSVPSKLSGPGVNDIGAAWINDTSQSEMYGLLRKYGLHGEIQRAEGMSLSLTAEGVITHPYGTLPLDEHDQVLVASVLQTIQGLVDQIDLKNPAAGSIGKELDSMTASEYCSKTFQSDLVVGIVDTVTQSLLGVEAASISMLSLVHYIKAATGVDAALSDGKDGGQYLRVREGTQSFSRKMAEALEPGTLFLSTPVTSIEQSSQTCICTVRTSSPTNSTFHAKKVILSIPTPLYHKISFDPPLPEDKTRLASDNILGYYSKMIYVFDQPWWRTAGLSGVMETDLGPILFSRDTSIPDDDQWSITCFIVGKRGREWSLLSSSERRRTAWDQFRTTFESASGLSGKLDVPEPINVLEIEWTKQEFFGGAPCPVSPPGLLSSVDASAAQCPFKDVHFVGTETAFVWRGYMEGAVRSGIRGAKEVIDLLKG
ncbi:FAD/NAD(P)-binding domain-containing protein [Aspergillus campestris IBT 28561]|uniref:Amine oxidase n=1 Tax=Aspergillus campestris (strain IBT 28561) TaxID=1392248 RepID=A0A2I1CYP3_ASPC2|nr:FAD/NAD(P)-binding domain-containing protein [Aspergillus campestris IBT 28561]PKY02738.1 FAD/NAD(P)-binding domain-containing protein [Aspergillus campestris IBT 28561]